MSNLRFTLAGARRDMLSIVCRGEFRMLYGYWVVSTLLISGICSFKMRSTPILRVMVDMGHVPHAPVSLTLTTPLTTSTNSTSPPSACKVGLIFANAASTFSRMVGSFWYPYYFVIIPTPGDVNLL